MKESNQSPEQINEASGTKNKRKKSKPENFKPSPSDKEIDSSPKEENVLLNVWKFKYKLPGKRQRVIIGSIVLGLNLLLVILVAIYFYSPAFQDFIYNVGRDVA